MPTHFLCIAVAFALVYVPLGLREAMPKADWARRLKSAYSSAAVGFPGFAAAVILAHLQGSDERRLTVLSVAYVVARGLQIGAVAADLPFMRRALWGLSLFVTLALFALPLLAT